MPVEVKYTPGVVPITVVKGDDWEIPYTKTNSPVSMSGWTFLFQVREAEGRANTLVTTLSVVTTDASSGTVLFTKAAADTEALTAGTYFYELQRTVSSKTRTVLKGTFTIANDTADT